MIRFLKSFFRLHREEFEARLADHHEAAPASTLTVDEVRKIVREAVAAEMYRLRADLRGISGYGPRV